MDPGADSRDVGRHLLGPHVVGTRVVVRRVLRGQTGPSGGPALTDVLGVCTAWGDGRCVVRTDRGDVEIRLADIVSGKPVPPRPSVRSRVPAVEVERHAFVLWPGLRVEPLGEWALRSHPTVERRRATSCLAMGDPGLPFPSAERAVREWYAARGRRALVQVERESPVEQAFRAAGWEALGDGDASCLLAGVSRVRRSLGRTAGGELSAEGDRATVTVQGSARGEAALSGDWLGVHGVHVSPEHRRQGLARQVIGELVEWGAERGALTVWLHVETDNRAAWELYESLGFAVHHSYRYLTPG